MANKHQMETLLLTQDAFLYIALSNILPGLKWVQTFSQSKNIIPRVAERFCILVDNRTPYIDFEMICEQFNKSHTGGDCILLELRHGPYLKKGFDKIKKIDMRLNTKAVEQALSARMCEKKYFPPENVRKIESYLNESHYIIMSMGLEGMSIRRIAEIFECPNNQLYIYREQLYKDLGFNSFNAACVFLLQNKLLSETGKFNDVI
jgi:hypothetical protein